MTATVETPVRSGAAPVEERAVAPARRRRSRTGPLRYLSLLGLLAVWQVATWAGWTSPDTLPGPAKVASAAWDLWSSGALVDALGVSLQRVLIGTAIGLVAGLGLGLLSGFSRKAELVVDAPVQAFRAVPFTALVPLFILWFGVDETPKVAIVAVGVAFPVYINTFAGIRDVDSKLVDVARVYRLSRLQIARRVLLPGALPSLLVGLRFALTLAWIAVIVAEQLNASAGIGFLLTQARQFLQADVMVVCIALYATLGLLTDLLVRAVERRVLVWRQAYSGN
ncbi:ABC transporter permease [Motilibacter deserti]|uniref:ABC transporter permease n=1 Tax=Motilibacter deserti TaxID=2714956 RepID=UPI002F2B7129